MNRHADRDMLQRQAVANVRRSVWAAHDLGASREAVGRDNVSLFAVYIMQQRDSSRAVGIVLNRIDHRRHAILVAAKIDHAVSPLVTSATMPRGDPPLI